MPAAQFPSISVKKNPGRFSEFKSSVSSRPSFRIVKLFDEHLQGAVHDKSGIKLHNTKFRVGASESLRHYKDSS